MRLYTDYLFVHQEEMGYLYGRGSRAYVLCTKAGGKDAKLITKYLNTVLDSNLSYICFQERNTLRYTSKKCESEVEIENNTDNL